MPRLIVTINIVASKSRSVKQPRPPFCTICPDSSIRPAIRPFLRLYMILSSRNRPRRPLVSTRERSRWPRPASRPFSAPPVACHARTLPAAPPPFYVCASIGRDRVLRRADPRAAQVRRGAAARRGRCSLVIEAHAGAGVTVPRAALPPPGDTGISPPAGSSRCPSMPLYGPPAAVPGPRTLARRRSRAPAARFGPRMGSGRPSPGVGTVSP